MKSKPQEGEDLEMLEFDQVETDVLVDDFKDMKIDMFASRLIAYLSWNSI